MVEIVNAFEYERLEMLQLFAAYDDDDEAECTIDLEAAKTAVCQQLIATFLSQVYEEGVNEHDLAENPVLNQKGEPAAIKRDHACLDELCSICYTSELGEERCVQLGCGHVFHASCLANLLGYKWSTLRITFGFMACPACKAPLEGIECAEAGLAEKFNELVQLREKVREDALRVAINQGLDKDPAIVPAKGKKRPSKEAITDLAMKKCAFYECNKCTGHFFGGLIDCEQEVAQQDQRTKEDLLCRKCVLEMHGRAGSDTCEKHGTEYIDWKCQFCCSVALFHCFGTTYFCDDCHEEYCRTGALPAEKHRDCGGKNCPLGVDHPPASWDKSAIYSLGCSACRQEKMEELKDKFIEEIPTQEAFKIISFEEQRRQHREAEERRRNEDWQFPIWIFRQEGEQPERPRVEIPDDLDDEVELPMEMFAEEGDEEQREEEDEDFELPMEMFAEEEQEEQQMEEEDDDFWFFDLFEDFFSDEQDEEQRDDHDFELPMEMFAEEKDEAFDFYDVELPIEMFAEEEDNDVLQPEPEQEENPQQGPAAVAPPEENLDNLEFFLKDMEAFAGEYDDHKIMPAPFAAEYPILAKVDSLVKSVIEIAFPAFAY